LTWKNIPALGVTVKAGTPKPDISSVEAAKKGCC
jgi:hypothetical protein